jgi:hypothetical protein
MPDKIKFADLVALVQSGEITKAQIQQYFEIDGIRTVGLQPVFKLKPDAVDVAGVEQAAAASAHALALQAEHATQNGRTKTFAGAAYTIIAEGDSWFSHPLNTTVIDVLQSSGRNINNMAVAGATLEDMVTKAKYMHDLKSGTVTHFLFSGGGNDVIGRLRECVNIFNSGHGNPENVSDVDYYIKSAFYDNVMQGIKSLYHELVTQVQTYSPSTILMLHGYAHARPFAHGPFLGKIFDHDLGFDLLNSEYKALTWKIVMKLVDAFNSFIISLANTSPKIEYFDFRPVVRARLGPPRHRTFGVDADWFDFELHPSPAAANRMATTYSSGLPKPAVAGLRVGRKRTPRLRGTA